jgi:hypothetical protein
MGSSREAGYPSAATVFEEKEEVDCSFVSYLQRI